jgi:hypothetical protein
MASSVYHAAQKRKVRVTLEFEVRDDFDAHQINYDDVFQLEGDETVSAYVEELDATNW